MIIYFAGVNQHQWAEQFAGLHVLESFADVRPMMDRYRPTFAGMVLDSGAFTELTTAKKIDLGAYADFVLEHGRFYRWVASLDSIDGGAAANIRNLTDLRDRGVDAVPTFHQGEPFELLADYCRMHDRIGLGFQRPIANARSWLGECFSRIPSGIRVHGWAMTSYTDFPFESVDSRTWLFEVKALMSVAGQGADALRCLTPGELVAIVQKKYERLPKRQKWGEPKAVQLKMLGETA